MYTEYTTFVNRSKMNVYPHETWQTIHFNVYRLLKTVTIVCGPFFCSKENESYDNPALVKELQRASNTLPSLSLMCLKDHAETHAHIVRHFLLLVEPNDMYHPKTRWHVRKKMS